MGMIVECLKRERTLNSSSDLLTLRVSWSAQTVRQEVAVLPWPEAFLVFCLWTDLECRWGSVGERGWMVGQLVVWCLRGWGWWTVIYPTCNKSLSVHQRFHTDPESLASESVAPLCYHDLTYWRVSGPVASVGLHFGLEKLPEFGSKRVCCDCTCRRFGRHVLTKKRCHSVGELFQVWKQQRPQKHNNQCSQTGL